MSNPTSNFGWQMPTATDLVTDLPADFEVFGQAVDTSLADLKGGTTGQVLKKNTNADMDFVWGAAGGSPLTTKGDLYGYSTADARVPVGTNGFLLQADSTAATGLSYTGSRWATLASGSLSGTEVSIGSFSSAYQTLRLEIIGPQSATGGVHVTVRANSVSTSSYEGAAFNSNNTAVTNYSPKTGFYPMFENETVPTSSNTYSMYIEIDNYTQAIRKFIRGMWNQTDNVWFGGHNFNNTTAITSLQIRLDGTATFNGGTYVLRGI
jgi:hypothetical protein